MKLQRETAGSIHGERCTGGILLLLAALLACCSRGSPTPHGAKPSSQPEPAGSQRFKTRREDPGRKRVGLKDLPGAQKFKLGAATDYPQICSAELISDCKTSQAARDSKDHVRVLLREHNVIVPGIEMKWEVIHPEEKSYAFDHADAYVDFAQKNKLLVRGHTLVWHNQIPDWVFPKGNRKCGRRNKAELLRVLEDHIKTVVGHFRGEIESWDVVNEPFRDADHLPGANRKHWLKTCWLRVIGEEYIEQAFRWAREADPKAKLVLNEDKAEELNNESNTLYQHVKRLRAKGVPIDGVGFQFHLELNDYPDRAAMDRSFKSMDRNMRRFGDLGLDIYFTEIDVGICGRGTPEKLKRQAEIYRRIFALAKRHSAVKSVLVWGVSDKHSWLPGEGKFRGCQKSYGLGLLFDDHFLPKPAYFAVREELSSP